jgi:hypothetical protein
MCFCACSASGSLLQALLQAPLQCLRACSAGGSLHGCSTGVSWNGKVLCEPHCLAVQIV